MSSPAKQIQVTLPKELAERVAFLRKFRHRLPDFQADLERVIRDLVTVNETRLKINAETWKTARPCPKCTNGTLLRRESKRPGSAGFLGCNRFPECRHTEPLDEPDKKRS